MALNLFGKNFLDEKFMPADACRVVQVWPPDTIGRRTECQRMKVGQRKMDDRWSRVARKTMNWIGRTVVRKIRNASRYPLPEFEDTGEGRLQNHPEGITVIEV